MQRRLHLFLLSLVGLALLTFGYGAFAHRSECHSAHSCPSDADSYVCGDTGNCNFCPDNQYCSDKKTVQKQTQVASTSVQATSTEAAPAKEANAAVTKVVDGDTIEAKLDSDGKIYKIRYLGINTPETVDPRKPVECFGKEASNKMKELVSDKHIRLEADPQADERDKYDRLLRNVYLEDGTDVNALMVREGYAYAYLSFPLDAKRKAELKKLEQGAKMAGRGLWSLDACGGGK